jgi:6-phosphogluconolactonase
MVKPDFLPSQVDWYSAMNADYLVEQLSHKIVQELSYSLLDQTRVSLAVSGGRSPVKLFEKLSLTTLDWSRIDITLVDERWVSVGLEDSNEWLVRQHLLKGTAAKARFFGLKNKALTAKIGQNECQSVLHNLRLPLDLVVLGMGLDGHTASLFPCCPELSKAMDSKQSLSFVATTPSRASFERMSMSYTTLMNAKHRILHIVGFEKLNALERAISLQDYLAMPIFAFLQEPLTIYWSP